MRLHVLTIGKPRLAFAKAGIAEYLERFPPKQPVEIDALRERLCGNIKIEPYPYLRKGRRVRVRNGPMQGLEGIVVRRKDHCRTVFSIDLIMRSVAIEVDQSDLESA